MTPGSLPLSLYRGDSYVWTFTLWSDAEKTQPADLTEVTAKAEIRASAGGVLVAMIECAIEPPNVIAARLSAAESGKLTAAGGAWDLQLTYSDGSVATILAGAVKVTMDVTDSAATAQPSAAAPVGMAALRQAPLRQARLA